MTAQKEVDKMAFCMNCGQELPSGAKFCSGCGTATGEVGADTACRKTTYDGELHKCPNCGEIVDAFVTKCSACGYELRDAKNSNAVREFAEKIEQIELQRISDNGLFKGIKKNSAGLGKVHPIDEQKISLIRSFAIPNTKEDIYEFMILAASNIDMKLYSMAYDSSQFQGMLVASQKAVSDAWLAKFEQAHQKAKLTFGNSSEFLYLDDLYTKKMKELKWKKLQFPLFIVGLIIFLFIFLFGIIL